MNLKKTIIAVIILILIGLTVFAVKKKGFKPFASTPTSVTDDSAGGPPDEEDLYGYWERIDMPDTPEFRNSVDPWPSKYQWFYFDKNKKIYSLESEQSNHLSASELEKIFKTFIPKEVPNFTYEGSFLKVDNPFIPGYQEMWGINQFNQDIKTFQKGEVIMTLDSGSIRHKSDEVGHMTGEVIYYRRLRKLQ